MRRQGIIHRHTSIAVDILNSILYFWTDSGRLIRPVLIAHNNEQTDEQYIKLTRSVLNDLTTGKVRFNDLFDNQIMEYISDQE